MGGVFGLASVDRPGDRRLPDRRPGWRWCFYVNMPVGIAAFAVLLLRLPAHRARSGTTSRRSTGSARRRSCSPWCRCCWRSHGAAATTPGPRPRHLALLSIRLRDAGGVSSRVEMRAPEAIIAVPRFQEPRRLDLRRRRDARVDGDVRHDAVHPALHPGRDRHVCATRSGAVLTPMMFALIVASIASGQLVSEARQVQVIAIVGTATMRSACSCSSRMDADDELLHGAAQHDGHGRGAGRDDADLQLSVQNAVDMSQVGVATSSDAVSADDGRLHWRGDFRRGAEQPVRRRAGAGPAGGRRRGAAAGYSRGVQESPGADEPRGRRPLASRRSGGRPSSSLRCSVRCDRRWPRRCRTSSFAARSSWASARASRRSSSTSRSGRPTGG